MFAYKRIAVKPGLPVDPMKRLPEVDRRLGLATITTRIREKFHLQRRLSPAVPREESQRVLRHRRLRSSLQTRGVTCGGEGVEAVKPRVLFWNQRVTSRLRRLSRNFCGETPTAFGVNVYRKSTGDPTPGKSSAKGQWGSAALAAVLRAQI
jgi:hypothetical protein